LCSLPLYGADLKVAGAPATAPSAYTFARMAACGHTIAHWLHWMQTFASHTGISSARFRFSHFAVPTGQVPSTGKALTGSRSPLPASITAVTRCTKSGACWATTGGRVRVAFAACGTGISCRWASAWSTRSQFRRTTSGPRLPYVFSIAFLIWAMASSRGRMPAMPKKQVCMIVLMRVPMPARRARS
jgi:hypothetical protein